VTLVSLKARVTAIARWTQGRRFACYRHAR
jgi:hypothetical protein